MRLAERELEKFTIWVLVELNPSTGKQKGRGGLRGNLQKEGVPLGNSPTEGARLSKKNSKPKKTGMQKAMEKKNKTGNLGRVWGKLKN